MKKLTKLTVFFIIFLAVQGFSLAQDNNIAVKVGISNTNFNTYLFDSVEFNNTDDIEIMDSATGYVVPKSEKTNIYKVTSENKLFRVYADDVLLARNLTGPILVRPISNNGLVSVNGLKRKGKQALYRGFIELTRSKKDNDKFAIVNVLSLNNYLKGVVPNEMPVRFGLEALKAQTVAARNYAVAPRIKAYEEFDVCDSVACQVYYGANTEEPLADKAVEETNGIIALDNENKPILALYSSTAGGYTESYEYAFSDPKTKSFPSNPIHYLTAVPDNKKFKKLNTEKAAEEFYTSKPDAFDDLSPYYRWSKEWTKDELGKILPKTLVAQSKTGFISPALEKEEDFGNLESIEVLQRGESGKVISLKINTDKNAYIVQKELVIRRCFPKNGISLPSANFVINYVESEQPVYKFSGGGFGHGVGLSQWGAGKMASLGYKFDEILQHYYTGIKLTTMPLKIFQGRKYNEVIFRSDNEIAELVINSFGNEGSLHLSINDKEFEINFEKNMKPVKISKYLKKGNNNISMELKLNKILNNGYIETFFTVKEAADE